MKIVLISQFWPKVQKSGVAAAASTHVDALISGGHIVEVLGTCEGKLLDGVQMPYQHCISAKGSGSLYSPIKIELNILRDTLEIINPDLVVIEGWQTAIAESSVEIAVDMKVPVLMLSHGVSVHAFERRPIEWMRALAWRHYRHFILPKKIKKLTAITCLSCESHSPRFYDRDLAAKFGVPIFHLTNAPVNSKELEMVNSRQNRPLNLIIIGYFSRIKNQLAALELMQYLPTRFTLTLIGKRKGAYYERCKNFAIKHQLLDRVFFLEDHECVLSERISQSLVMLSTSITEALPIVLLEAMASGTPFIATPVGAVPELKGGVTCMTLVERIDAILKFESDVNWWNMYSKRGVEQYKSTYSADKVSTQLLEIVKKTVEIAKKSQ